MPVADQYFQLLSWDSDFFGFNVARINQFDDDSTVPLLEELYNEDVELAYYSASQEKNIPANPFYNVKMVDIKTTYIKKVGGKKVEVPMIISYTEKEPGEQLKRLSVQSGVYSRFNVDEQIGHEKFVSLYTQWIIQSVNKTIAEEVLVYHLNDTIAGFVTLGIKNNRADIGIIAVDEGFRGKGIGKALMLQGESYFVDKQEMIQVVTQGNNLPACKLYESCGYTIEKTEFFYHLWKKK